MSRHGTRACHTSGCRRPECIAADREYQRDYWALRRRIIGHDARIPSTPVTAHVEWCQSQGMTVRRIAQAAGVSESTLRGLRDRPRSTVRTGTARRVLAVRPGPSAVGLTRRVRALAAMGWSTSQIAAVAGLNEDTVKEFRRGQKTYALTATQPLLTAYARLSMTEPPARTRYERAAITAVRGRAARNGWPVPLAWDDETIDDPSALPHVGEVDHSSPIPENVEWLLGLNPLATAEQIAARLGTSRSGVQKALKRAEREDLAATLRRNAAVAA